ncbi:MAG: hypothetical protein ACK4TA_06065 [Saprospiraceae bacterium]
MRLITIIFVLFLIKDLNAQTQKGSWMLGGSISSNLIFAEDAFNFNISPGAGYFVLNGLALGLQPSWGYARSETPNTGFFKSYDYALTPSAKYFLKVNKVIYPFAGLSYGWNRTIGRSEKGTLDYDYSGNMLEFDTGILLFVNDFIGIENAAVYQRNDSEATFTVRKNWTFRIGVRAFLPQKAPRN